MVGHDLMGMRGVCSCIALSPELSPWDLGAASGASDGRDEVVSMDENFVWFLVFGVAIWKLVSLSLPCLCISLACSLVKSGSCSCQLDLAEDEQGKQET